MSTICGGGWSSLLLAATLAAGVSQAATPPPDAAAITFNTACARCHEGECSGRLSLGGGESSVAGHIRRYLDPFRDDEVAALFDQLKYMKEHCAYRPLRAPVPRDRVWDRKALQSLFSPGGKGYFIPLGLLEPGRYAISFRFDRATEASLQVLSPQFASLLESNGFASHGALGASFVSETRERYFLRLFPGDRARLVEMRVTVQGRESAKKK